MVLTLATGCAGFSSAAGNWAYYGTGHDHSRAMGLETIGCAVAMDILEPRIFRIFHCNVGAAMYFAVTSTQEAQKTKN